MYMIRQVGFPTLGKEAELRSQLVELARTLQAKGRRVALSQQLFSSTGAALVLNTQVGDLAEAERIRGEIVADATLQERVRGLSALMRAPSVTMVIESIIPLPSGTTGAVGEIVQRIYAYPALGRERDVRAIAEEAIRDAQKAGIRTSLWQRVFSHEGSVLESTALYANLAELDRVRQERRAAGQVTLTALNELSRAPVVTGLLEVLVPFPS